MKGQLLLTYFFLSCTVLSMVSCNEIGSVKFEESPSRDGGISSGDYSDDEIGYAPISFTGITSVTNKTDSSLTLNWGSHPDALVYFIFNTTNGISVAGIAQNQSDNSFELTGLSPGSFYKFRVRIMTAEGKYDANENDIEVTMNSSPNTPTAISRVTPRIASDDNATPSYKVTGVKARDYVTLFSDSTCSTKVSSDVQVPDEESEVTLSTNALPVGTYTLYTATRNSNGNYSNCIASGSAYEVLAACPTGYIRVKANPSVGTNNDFCMAKYEMKNVGGVPTSEAAGTPWTTTVSQTNAISLCDSLNTPPASNYALMSNEEWMTVARDIEAVDSNWYDPATGEETSVNSGLINRGHSDNDPASAISADLDDDEGFSGTGNLATQDPEQKRTHMLSNDKIVWDFAGNAVELTSWTVTCGGGDCKKAYSQLNNPNADLFSFREINLLDRRIGENGDDEMLPATYSPTTSSLDSTNGIGQYFFGSYNYGGVAVRGGRYNDGAAAGIYSLNLYLAPADTLTGVGFRCVYHF